MSNAKTVLILAPTPAEQARAEELAAALQAAGQAARQMMIDGNYEQVLDALLDPVVPVVIK